METRFEFQRPIETLTKPFEQKTEITGHLLPGVVISKQFCQDFASGCAAITGMTIFGPFVYKDPTNFDNETVAQLGRKPRDYNFSQMWSNSGMDGYIFPEDNMYATLKFHTCDGYDSQKLLQYVHETLGFDIDMRHTEIQQGNTIINNRLYKRQEQLQKEISYAKSLALLYQQPLPKWTDPHEPVTIVPRMKQIITSAIADGVDQRVASYFTVREKIAFQVLYGNEEVKIDSNFMFLVKEGSVKSPEEHPLKKEYDRLSRREVVAARIAKDDKILHLGSGYGTTGVSEYLQFGFPFTCLEVQPDVAKQCRDTFDAFGLLEQNKLQVACVDARDIDPKGYDVIIISAMVPEKAKLEILDNISKLQWGKKDNRRLIIRTPASPIQSFFYPILTTDKILSRPELTLIADTGSMCGPEDPLRSLVFKVSDNISEITERAEQHSESGSADSAMMDRLLSLRPKLRPVSDFII